MSTEETHVKLALGMGQAANQRIMSVILSHAAESGQPMQPVVDLLFCLALYIEVLGETVTGDQILETFQQTRSVAAEEAPIVRDIIDSMKDNDVTGGPIVH